MSTRCSRKDEGAPWLRASSASALLALVLSVSSWLAPVPAQEVTGGPRPEPAYGRPEIVAPPRVHPEDPHRFAVGEWVFFPVGHYGGALTATSSDWSGDIEAMNRAFLDTLARHGLNYARAWVNWGGLPTSGDAWNAHMEHPWARVTVREGAEGRAPDLTAVDGRPPFDLSRFNDRHFELIAGALDLALQRGVVLQLVVFDCWHLVARPGSRGEAPSGVAYDPLHPRNNASGVSVTTAREWVDPAGPAFRTHARYVRELVRRVGDRPNLVWEACNENSINYPEFDLAIADLITETERELGLAPHLVMPRDLPDHRRVAGHFTPAGDRPQHEVGLTEMRRLLVEQREWRQPLISDNDCCRDRGRPAFRRRKLWTALSAGAHVDYFVAGLPHDRGLLESRDVSRSLAFFGQVFRFFDAAGVDLVGMRPCAVEGDGWALCRDDDAPRGPEWIGYLPRGGRVRFEGLPSPRRACWFDPRAGAFEEAPGGPVYEAPGGRDWVLHIEAGAGACPRDQ